MMKSSVFGAAQTFNRLRSTLNTGAVHAGARQPFKFLLCGDPGLVAAFRALMLTGTGDDIGAAVALETFTAGAPVDLNRFTAALIGRVLLAYERFADGEHVDSFAELWNRYDVLRGREVTLVESGRKRRGRALGVDDVGSLLIRDERGRTHGCRAGEVTVEKGG